MVNGLSNKCQANIKNLVSQCFIGYLAVQQSKWRRLREDTVVMQRNSGDGSSLSSDESAFLPNKEEDVLDHGKWLAEELSWSTDSSSCTSLVSRSPVKARKHSKTLKELDAATKSELEAIIEESKRLLAETKTKKVTDESKLKAFATPQRRPNNSTFITPQPQRQRQNLRAPNTSATPGKISTEQLLASFRKDAKEYACC